MTNGQRHMFSPITVSTRSADRSLYDTGLGTAARGLLIMLDQISSQAFAVYAV